MVAKGKSKSVQQTPFPDTDGSQKKTMKHPLFTKTPRNFRIGGSIRPKVDLGRYVRWPRYIRLQRQRRVLYQRLKVPPALNQFNCAINRNQTQQLFRILSKYMPETRQEKKMRLTKAAEAKLENREVPTKKPVVLKFGLNHATDLIELKKAKLVVIAHDVDPIELVCWLPALCRQKDIPFCIVKGKSRLGQLVHKKTASCVVVDSIREEHHHEFNNLVKAFRAQFNENTEMRRQWGGGISGIKSRHAQEKKEKLVAKEQAKKLTY